jgi:hypothetical protein
MLDHVLARRRSFRLIYPTWLIPIVVRYQPVLRFGIGQFRSLSAMACQSELIVIYNTNHHILFKLV